MKFSIREKRLEKFEDKLNKIEGYLDIVTEKIHLQETKLLVNENKVKQLDLMQSKNMLKFEGLADEEDKYLLDKILKLINQGMRVKCEERYINEIYRLGKSKKNENVQFAPKGLPQYSSCGYATKSFGCSTLKKFHESFYSSENKLIMCCPNRKKVRKIEVLTKPSQYVDIVSESGSVFHLDEDCEVHDWKEAVSEHLTSTASWNFPFRQTKRFYLTRYRSGSVFIRGEPYYRNDLNTAKNVFKKGKTPKTIRPKLINRCNNRISNLKTNNVKKLLKNHFGENWRELQELAFYNDVIAEETVITDPQETNDDDTNCEFVEELPAVLI
ncbi:unnamed protein product [Psylliodes chrysocephalus]|uniref:Uncharacterized protein n=1 Tax=Psylliodes chrysocephalus TaxID=3402493 RepID=A0A9P0CH66_9CUCU|nr:unnamed protein product [Psylliodes chrysocephala]